MRRAAAEPEVAALLAESRRACGGDQRRLVELRAQAGHLRPSLDVDAAADILHGLVNEEVFLLLTADCGWSRQRFEDWLATLRRHELVEPVGRRRRSLTWTKIPMGAALVEGLLGGRSWASDRLSDGLAAEV